MTMHHDAEKGLASNIKELEKLLSDYKKLEEKIKKSISEFKGYAEYNKPPAFREISFHVGGNN